MNIKVKKICKDSNEKYHKSKSISASGLKTISAKSPSEYVNKTFTTNKNVELGSAIHTYILEPYNFKDEFYIMPNLDLRTKVGRELKQAHLVEANGKILLTKKDMDLLDQIKEAFKNNTEANELLDNKIEISYYGEIDDVPVRCRPDIVADDFIVDLKSCQDASPFEFMKTAKHWRWYLQAVFYSDFLQMSAEKFKFIAISKTEKPRVEVYGLMDKNIDLGRWQWKEALSRWKFYLDTGLCPGEYWTNFRNNTKLI